MDLKEFQQELERICKKLANDKGKEESGRECTGFREVRTVFCMGVDVIFVERGHCGRRAKKVAYLTLCMSASPHQ